MGDTCLVWQLAELCGGHHILGRLNLACTSPSLFTLHLFTPHLFTPRSFTPHIFTPRLFTPHVFTPRLFTPHSSQPVSQCRGGRLSIRMGCQIRQVTPNAGTSPRAWRARRAHPLGRRVRRRRRRIEFGNGLSHIDKPSAPEAQEDGSWDLALNAPRARAAPIISVHQAPGHPWPLAICGIRGTNRTFSNFGSRLGTISTLFPRFTHSSLSGWRP